MKKENIISFSIGLFLSALIFISIQLFSICKSNRYEGGMHDTGCTYILDKRTGEMRIFLGEGEPFMTINYNFEKKSENEK